MFTVGGTIAGPPLYVGNPDTVMSCACRWVLGGGLAAGVAPAPVVPIVAKLPAPAEPLADRVPVLGVALAAAADLPSAAESRQPVRVPVQAAAVMAAAVTVLSATDARRWGRGMLTLEMSAHPAAI
jgi:hypothetical protein